MIAPHSPAVPTVRVGTATRGNSVGGATLPRPHSAAAASIVGMSRMTAGGDATPAALRSSGGGFVTSAARAARPVLLGTVTVAVGRTGGRAVSAGCTAGGAEPAGVGVATDGAAVVAGEGAPD